MAVLQTAIKPVTKVIMLLPGLEPVIKFQANKRTCMWSNTPAKEFYFLSENTVFWIVPIDSDLSFAHLANIQLKSHNFITGSAVIFQSLLPVPNVWMPGKETEKQTQQVDSNWGIRCWQ